MKRWLHYIALLAFSLSAQASERRLLIPPYSNQPTPVKIGVYYIDFREVTMMPQDFSATGYIILEWKDHRLTFDPVRSKENYHYFSHKEVWNPKVELVNATKTEFIIYDRVTVSPDGTASTTIRFSGTFSSEFHLATFPFDSQNLVLQVEPFHGDDDEIIFVNDPSKNGISPHAFLEEWEIGSLTSAVSAEKLPFEQTQFSHAKFNVPVKRLPAYFLWRFILPLFLLTALSWATLWIRLDNLGLEWENSRTLLLTIVALGISLNLSMPHVGYLSFLDAFMLSCFISVLLLTLENILTYSLYTRGFHAVALKVRLGARAFFPLSFFAVLFILAKVML